MHIETPGRNAYFAPGVKDKETIAHLVNGVHGPLKHIGDFRNASRDGARKNWVWARVKRWFRTNACDARPDCAHGPPTARGKGLSP